MYHLRSTTPIHAATKTFIELARQVSLSKKRTAPMTDKIYRRHSDTTVHRQAVFSMLLILVFIFLLVPWQVAFLGAWTIHLYTCATSPRPHGESPHSPDSPSKNEEKPPSALSDIHNINLHLLILLTLLLPLVAPVLAVWVRTLATAGFTMPFDGDHNPLYAAPFLVLVDFASWTRDRLLPRQMYASPAQSQVQC